MKAPADVDTKQGESSGRSYTNGKPESSGKITPEAGRKLAADHTRRQSSGDPGSDYKRKGGTMTLDDIKKIIAFQTAAIGEADKDPDTHNYIVNCLMRLYSGDYGEIPPDDTDANNKELEAGQGRIVARYKKAEQLEEDIYIIAEFDDSTDDINSNYLTVLYCSEY